MKFLVKLEPSDEGGFTVWVPALRGCVSEGDSYDEAIANIREAIELYLEPIDEDELSSSTVRIDEVTVWAHTRRSRMSESWRHFSAVDGKCFVSEVATSVW